MLDQLLSLPGPVAGGLVVAVAVSLTVAGLGAVRRRVGVETLRAGNEVAGLLYGTLAGIYAILLAFVLVSVWEDFGQAEERVEAEVTSVGTMFWDANNFSAADRATVHDALLGYLTSVVEDEWPTMAHGEGSPRTLAAYGRLWNVYAGIDPGEGPASVYYEQSIDRLAQVGESRRGRILASRSGVPATMWLLLLSGAFVVTGLAFMLGSENPNTHRIAVAALAAVVSSVLFVTVALDRPFGEGISVSPRPYVSLHDQWAR
ncbi:MAG TPA: hypothetical protein VF519_01255 [Mycobacteriales bacterium]|jgi:hypothetical protein